MLKLKKVLKQLQNIIIVGIVIVIICSIFFIITKDTGIPKLYILAEKENIAEAMLGNYNWNFKKATSEETFLDNAQIYDFEYGETSTIIAEKGQKLYISNENIAGSFKGSDAVLNIYKSYGALYSKDFKLYSDSKDVYVLSPEESGEYIYEINAKYDRGTVNYVFKVIVTYTEQNKLSDESIQNLYNNKTQDIKDKNKVDEIIKALELPENFTLKDFEVVTSNRPYGININLKTTAHKMDVNIMSIPLRFRAVILLSLIDDADYIQFTVLGDGNQSFKYTRQWANKTITGNGITYTEDLNDWKEFVLKIGKKYLMPPSILDKPSPGVKVNIEMSGSAADAMELIYEDEHYQYYLSAIMSDKVMLKFDNGEKKSLKESLEMKKISIEDLILNGQSMYIRQKNNPYDGYFPIPFISYKFYIKEAEKETEFYPSNTFMYSEVDSTGGNILYFAINDVLHYLDVTGYKEKADMIRKDNSLFEKKMIIEGITYFSRSELHSIGILVNIDREQYNPQIIDFSINS